jgi:hypothetical protein
MVVRYKHPNVNHLSNLVHIELSHVPTAIIQCNNIWEFETLTDLELKKLYESMCGQKYTGYSRYILIQNVFNLCKLLPNSELNGFALDCQANFIQEDDDRFYRYQPTARVPKLQQELYLAKPLTASAAYNPVLTSTYAPQTAPASTPQAQTAQTQAPKQQTARATREPSGEAPKQGSKTGRVWEIAEELYKNAVGVVNFKLLRSAIVSACEGEGINSSTASVQYGKWKNTKT